MANNASNPIPDFDTTPGCYLTNYLVAVVSLYFAVRFYRKNRLIDLGQDLDQDSEKRKNSWQLNRKLVLYSLSFTNTLCALSLISAAIVHAHFNFKGTTGNKLFWKLAQMFIALAFPFYFSSPLLFVFKMTNFSLARKIGGVGLAFGGLFAIEEFIWEGLTFAIVLPLSYLLLGIFGVLPTVRMVMWKKSKEQETATNTLGYYDYFTNRGLTFKPFTFYLSIFFLLSTFIAYVNIRPLCSQDFVEHTNNCPFPDWFNHNAVLHSSILIGMVGLNLAYSE